MKERPIIFSGEMVKAILDGRKTQTRRVVKLSNLAKFQVHDWVKSIHQDGGGNWVAWDSDEEGLAEFTKKAYPKGEGFKCPYGISGDRLWVRETWKDIYGVPIYKADRKDANQFNWTPSIHMPRWASRLTLQIVKVRVERLDDISEDDARAEGCRPTEYEEPFNPSSARTEFKNLWDSINEKRGFGWDTNPWVWAVEFKPVEPHV